MTAPTPASPRRTRRVVLHLVGWLLVAALGVWLAFVVFAENELKQTKKQAVDNLDTWIAYGFEGYGRYQGQDRMIPRAILDKSGKPLLSWRVAVLPYIEERVLFGEFKFDEPWDGPHNIKLLEKMPTKFASPTKNNRPGETFYQAFTGPRTAFPDPATGPLPLFKDCASRLLVVEAGESVPWTKPQDLVYDPDGPLAPLGGVFGSGEFHGVFGDRTVKWFSRPAEAELKAYIEGR